MHLDNPNRGVIDVVVTLAFNKKEEAALDIEVDFFHLLSSIYTVSPFYYD